MKRRTRERERIKTSVKHCIKPPARFVQNLSFAGRTYIFGNLFSAILNMPTAEPAKGIFGVYIEVAMPDGHADVGRM